MILSKKLLILVVFGMVAVGTVLLRGERRIPQSIPSDTREVWVIEDGIVAWRPMGPLEKAAIAVFSLGTAVGEDWVQGRTMPDADAASFRGLSVDYGVDRRSVWYKGENLKNADPHSFQIAAYGFARDANSIWRGNRRIRPNPTAIEAEFTAYSEAVYSLGQQGYYLDKDLPEMPEGEITAYCRDWYQMNNALWLGEKRLAPLSRNAQLIVCDDSFLTVNGIEDITENKGIALADGSAVILVNLAGQTQLLHQFDGKILQSANIKSPFSETDLMLVQLVDGSLYLADYQIGDGQVQYLGRYEKLDFSKVSAREGELWLGDDVYFIEPDRARVEGLFARQVGPADVKGDYVVAGGNIYRLGKLIARSGDYPLDFLDQSRFKIGPMCVHFGSYIGDLPENGGNDENKNRCDVYHPPEILYYNGLDIGFEKGVVPLSESEDGLVEYVLGKIFVRNPNHDTKVLRPEFVRSIRFFVESANGPQLIEVEYPSLPQVSPVQIKPNDSLSWSIVLRAPKQLEDIAYFLQLTHVPERAEVLIKDQHRFAYGIVELSPPSGDQ